jgi:RHS repeat-associated protein
VRPHAVSSVTATGNGGGRQTFTYDDVGNTTGIAQEPGNKVLASGATLASGSSMVSNSVRLTMQTDGNLVLYALKSGQSLWASGTAGHAGAVATMGTDGKFTVRTASGTVLWSSNTSTAGSVLRVQDDGQVNVTAPDGSVAWYTDTATSARAANGITFTYDDNGRLATATQDAGTAGKTTTGYVYDAAGTLLARTTTEGGTTSTTIFLGADQLTLDSTGKATADTRYYTAAGAPTAVRTATTGTTTTNLHFQAADPHGSALTDITADNTTLTRRAYTPFGQDRTTGGNPTTWPGQQGYVGGTPDTTTGLTNLGAREYDPALGRFLSVDPVLDPTDPQSLNGYAYADNTPLNASDPTGLMRDGGGDCSATDTCNVAGHPSSDCPPFCSPDGQPHGPSTGNNDWFDDVDYDIHPAHKKHHHSMVPGWASSAAHKTSHGLGVARNYTEAIVTTPEVWIGGAETAGSLTLMFMGASGDGAAGLLCATGVGCFAGAPLAAVSSAAVVAGAYSATQGAKDLGDGLNQAFNKASGDAPGGSSPETPGFDLDKASSSGRKIDPTDKRGELTMSGRALQKHAKLAQGNPNDWPVPVGRQNPAAWNEMGQDTLDSILNDPSLRITPYRGRINGIWQDSIDLRIGGGKGARFDTSGNFSGFLD